jgi:hypothetical protein
MAVCGVGMETFLPAIAPGDIRRTAFTEPESQGKILVPGSYF